MKASSVELKENEPSGLTPLNYVKDRRTWPSHEALFLYEQEVQKLLVWSPKHSDVFLWSSHEKQPILEQIKRVIFEES
jgi:hypothetical protein